MVHTLALAAVFVLAASCAHQASTPAAEPLAPAEEPTPDGATAPPDGEGAAAPEEVVVEPSAEGPLTLAQADAVPDGQAIRLIGWLWELPANCPPCPRGYLCERCLPPFHFFGDEPPYTGPGGTGRGFWVELIPSLTSPEISGDAIGQRFILSGVWSRDYRQPLGRLFEASEWTPAPAPVAPRSATGWRQTPKEAGRGLAALTDSTEVGGVRIRAVGSSYWRDFMPFVSRPGPDGGQPLYVMVAFELQNPTGERRRLTPSGYVVDGNGTEYPTPFRTVRTVEGSWDGVLEGGASLQVEIICYDGPYLPVRSVIRAVVTWRDDQGQEGTVVAPAHAIEQTL